MKKKIWQGEEKTKTESVEDENREIMKTETQDTSTDKIKMQCSKIKTEVDESEKSIENSIKTLEKMREDMQWSEKEYDGFTFDNSSLIPNKINNLNLLEDYSNQSWEEIGVARYVITFNAKKRKTRENISNEKIEESINFTGIKKPVVLLKDVSTMLGMEQKKILKLLDIKMLDYGEILLNENVYATYKPIFTEERKIKRIDMELSLTEKGLQVLQSKIVIDTKDIDEQ